LKLFALFPYQQISPYEEFIEPESEFLRNMQFYSFIKNINKILASFNSQEDNQTDTQTIPIFEEKTAEETGGQLGLFTQAIKETVQDIDFKCKVLGDKTEVENLINDICYVCEANGLYFLNYGESESKNPDGTPSNSRYLDFCLTDQRDAGTVRLIFMLRVSDHKLKDKRKDGSDRKESVKRKMQSMLEYDAKELQEYNPNATGDLYPHEKWIKVGGTMCPNYGAAINVIERMIAGYKQSAKSKESDGDTHEN
jgi:hypothetical protein